MTKRLSLILGVLIGLGTLTGSVLAVNDYFAKAADLELVALRLEQKIQQDRCDYMQRRIWRLEDRYSGCVDKMPPSVREEFRKLKADYRRECEH
jgi:hypothetical protein